jgi:hypothetical protein
MENHGGGFCKNPAGSMPVCHPIDRQSIIPIHEANPVRFRYMACPNNPQEISYW